MTWFLLVTMIKRVTDVSLRIYSRYLCTSTLEIDIEFSSQLNCSVASVLTEIRLISVSVVHLGKLLF